MKRAPITRARSTWNETTGFETVPGFYANGHERRVGDGLLYALVGDEPGGIHMSISHRGHNGKAIRYPRWDEIADARDALLPADLTFVMILPPADEYVALHDTTFHLHEHPARTPALEIDPAVVASVRDLLARHAPRDSAS